MIVLSHPSLKQSSSIHKHTMRFLHFNNDKKKKESKNGGIFVFYAKKPTPTRKRREKIRVPKQAKPAAEDAKPAAVGKLL